MWLTALPFPQGQQGSSVVGRQSGCSALVAAWPLLRVQDRLSMEHRATGNCTLAHEQCSPSCAVGHRHSCSLHGDSAREGSKCSYFDAFFTTLGAF